MQPKEGSESLVNIVNVRPLSDVTVNYCALIELQQSYSQHSFGVVVDSDLIEKDYFELMKHQIPIKRILYCQRLPYGDKEVFLMLANGDVIRDKLLIKETMIFKDVYTEMENRHGRCVVIGIGEIWVEGFEF